MRLGADDSIAQRGYPHMRFCSPDRLHGMSPGFACDTWSYMILFALYIGFSPFPSGIAGGIISGIANSLGPLPGHWKGLSKYPSYDYWHEQGMTPDSRRSLAEIITRFRPDVSLIEQRLV